MSYQGQFLPQEPLVVRPGTGPAYAGPVVILVDETTQSRAEFTALALRVAPGARIVGRSSAGADGDATSFALPGGLSATIMGRGVYYPDGRETQRIGLALDVVVQPTVKGIRAGWDELLEQAIRLLENRH